MKTNFFALSLTAVFFSGFAATALADEVTMPADAAAAAPAPASLPRKGELMSAVTKHYGEPAKRYAAVGGGGPKTPPITRWDYSGFSVFFENEHVVDAVVPGRPPHVDHVDRLQSANP